MQHIAEKLTEAISQPNQSEQGQHLPERSKTHLPSLSTSADGKKSLAVLLSQCFEVQKLYGKEPENMETTLQVFISVLGEYSPEDVTEAFKKHMKRSNEFPTPADIANIIDPEPKPLDKTVYVNLCRRRDHDAENLTDDEWRYLKRYECEVIKGFEKDDVSISALQTDNENLRRNLRDLKAENERVWNKCYTLQAEIYQLQQSNKKPDKETKLQRTIDYMRQLGAPESDVQQLIRLI